MRELLCRRAWPHGIDGIIFDCDGVLINSRDANITYYNRLLVEVGKPPMDKAQEDFVHMASERQAIEHILSADEVGRYYEIAAKVPYREVVLPLLELNAGAREVLAWIQASGLMMAVNTNRGQGMWNVLDKFGMRGLFDPVMTADIVSQPKPSPEGALRVLEAWKLEPERVMFVGDTLADSVAAAGAGVPFVAFRNPALEGAVCSVEGFHDLQALLAALLPALRPGAS